MLNLPSLLNSAWTSKKKNTVLKVSRRKGGDHQNELRTVWKIVSRSRPSKAEGGKGIRSILLVQEKGKSWI